VSPHKSAFSVDDPLTHPGGHTIVGVMSRIADLFFRVRPLPRSGRYPRGLSGRFARGLSGAIVGLFALALAWGPAAGMQDRVRAAQPAVAAVAELREATHALGQRAAAATSTITSLSAGAAGARAVVNASGGRVATEAARSWLTAAALAADELRKEIRAQLAGATVSGAGASPNEWIERFEWTAAATSEDVGARSVEPAATTAQVRDRTAEVNRLVRVDLQRVTATRAWLRSAGEAVAAEVAQWDSDQGRIAAEAEAARVAEQAARLRAQAEAEAAERARLEDAASRSAAPLAAGSGAGRASPPAAVTPVPPAAPGVYAEYVWTTGFQAELDACRGSVNMTPSFGIPVIGEHWSCGGSRFPTAAGTVVELSGVLSGRYVVGPVVAVLNQQTHRMGDVPRGSDLLYQTCIGGDNRRMSFTQLTRIG
jgi:hypothetical protein